MTHLSEIDALSGLADGSPGPAYTPPYEGAVQDEFAWHVVKYLHEDAVLRSEAELEARVAGHGPAVFAPDFVIELRRRGKAPRRVAVECGETPSLRDHQRRQRRDALLLASGAVEAVVRLRGSDLLYHMDDCLLLLAQWEPELFSARGLTNLDTLATREAKGLRLRPEQAACMVTYAIDPQAEEYFAERHLWHAANGTNPYILLRRYDARFPEAWMPHLDQAARRALELRPTGS